MASRFLPSHHRVRMASSPLRPPIGESVCARAQAQHYTDKRNLQIKRRNKMGDWEDRTIAIITLSICLAVIIVSVSYATS
jgi:hypothetical protein